MSVIVKGIDMPENCIDCFVKDKICHSWKDCPLVELPKKHGRLIDADRLIARLENEMQAGLAADTEKDEETKRFAYAIHKLLIEQVEAEKTVIESEE